MNSGSLRKSENLRCLKTNGKTYQNLCDTAKGVLTAKLIEMNAYIKKKKGFQVNNLMMHLGVSEKQEQTIPKISGRKEIMKTRAEINRT